MTALAVASADAAAIILSFAYFTRKISELNQEISSLKKDNELIASNFNEMKSQMQEICEHMHRQDRRLRKVEATPEEEEEDDVALAAAIAAKNYS